MQKNLLIIGAGGVAKVVAHKAAKYNHIFPKIHIASRNIAKCYDIIDSVYRKNASLAEAALEAHQLNALDIAATAKLIKDLSCSIVINVGTAFLNMSILQACIEAKANYIDTAIHEDPLKICETPPWYENYEWKRRLACEQAGITAILGAGFDPGVVNAYAALACCDYFDEISSIDIIDVNAGRHDKWFATNFDPEINFREFTGRVWSWQNNSWSKNEMFEVNKIWDLPVVGEQSTYLTGHDEIHSLSQNLKVKDIRFWMGFSEHYITVFNVLKNLGLLSEQPVKTAEGQEVVPLKLVKAVLPDPASLAANYKGKTCIGDMVKGSKDGKFRELFIYNISDHEQAFSDTESQAISYTAGIPPVASAILLASGEWDVKRMVNVEELPAKPFLSLLAKLGLPTYLKEGNENSKLFI